MAFPTETITPAKQFFGPIIAAFTSSAIGRVTAAKVKVAEEWLDVKGFTIQRIVETFQSGEHIELDLTLDEIADIDASTVRGKQASFTLKQISLSDATKMSILTIPKVRITVTDIDMDAMAKRVSTMTLHVVGYQDTAATALYTFDNAAVAA